MRIDYISYFVVCILNIALPYHENSHIYLEEVQTCLPTANSQELANIASRWEGSLSPFPPQIVAGKGGTFLAIQIWKFPKIGSPQYRHPSTTILLGNPKMVPLLVGNLTPKTANRK